METTSLHEHSGELIETRLELRDGGTWVVGLCPRCWESVAVRVPPGGPPGAATCAGGHTLRVKDLRSAGSVRHAA